MAVSGEVECARQVAFDCGETFLSGAESFLNRSELPADPALFRSDHVHRHSAAVDRLHQLLALPREVGLLPDELLALVFGFLVTRSKPDCTHRRNRARECPCHRD